MAEKSTTAVKGFQVYCSIWKPFMREELNCDHEYDNAFDCFSIKTEKDGLVVGHLPREIYIATKFVVVVQRLLQKITSDHYKNSPLFQGGLDIRCFVIVTLPATIRGQLLLSKY